MKLLGTGAMALLASGCGYGIKISTDFNAAADLARYRTFFVLFGNSSGNPVTDLQLASAVEAALTNKGWSEVPRAEADAVVVINTATPANHSYAGFYGSWGGQWRRGITASNAAFVEDYKPGTIVVDIFDTTTTRAVWHGFATDAASHTPTLAARANNGAVTRLFKPLPEPAPIIDAGSAIAQQAEPHIIFSETPAVLVLIDGTPIYRDVPGTDLQQVVNTQPLLLRDAAGVHYLRMFGRWMEAYTLSGPWAVSGMVPDDAIALLQRSGDSSPDPGSGAATESGSLPTIYVSRAPAELIVTNGEPQLTPLAGTPLLYVSNTSGHIFKEPTDQEFYVLTSGRWYRAWTTNGPWQPALDNQLPADFASIPVDMIGSTVH